MTAPESPDGLASTTARVGRFGLVGAALALAAASPTSQAAELTTLWQETFYERYKEDYVLGRVRAVAVAPEGGFCLAGTKDTVRRPSVIGDLNVWAMRLDATGAVVFDRAFGADGTETAARVAAPADGGCTVGGEKPGHPRRVDVWVLRLGPAGDLLWERTLGGPETDVASAVAVLPGGDTVVSTYVGRGPKNSVLRVERLDPEGELVWTLDPDELGIKPILIRIAALEGGHVLVSGQMRFPGAPIGYSALELDERGAVVRSATMDGKDWPHGFLALPGNGHLVASFDADARPSPTVRLRRFDVAAHELWRAEAQLFDDDTPPSLYTPFRADLVTLADGGIALLVERDFAKEYQDPRAQSDHWLLVFDADGRLKTRRLLADGRVDGAVIAGLTKWPSNLVEQRIDAWLRRLTLP